MADSTGVASGEILHLVRGQSPRRLETLERMPAEGYVWIDFSRESAQGWERFPLLLVGAEVDRRHLADAFEAAHKSFFDATPAYDFLVFEGLGARDDAVPFETRSIALFLFDRLLVTVRAPDSTSVVVLKQRFASGVTRSPASERVLAQMLLDILVSRFLAVREAFTRGMNAVQEELLDPKSPFNDWQQLLIGRREARRLEALCEAQLDALEDWHRSDRVEWTNPEETRLRDLTEHIGRVRYASADLERHIEAAVQLYFAATSHRTNEIVRVLTLFSAIFLPLTFLAGIYGMNFQYMPELHIAFAYPAVIVTMVLVAVGLLWYFRKRGYF